MPSVRSRCLFALLVGCSACGLLLIVRYAFPDSRSDFSAVWNGGKLLLEGGNPYELIGPGRPVEYLNNLHYPAISLVGVMPLAWLSEYWADLVFVFSSAALLAFGATKENWNRIWIFPSAAFIIGARAGQFTPLIAAGYFIPWAAAVLPIKPSSGLAIMASWTDRRAWYASGAVAIVLLAVSFALMPDWVPQWLHSTVSSKEYQPPVMKMGGFVLLFAALRWRTREGRLLLALSLMPMVSSWYEALLPMLVARTKRECQVLSLVSSTGYLLLIPLGMMSPNGEIAIGTVGNMMIAFAYLPALIIVLRQPKLLEV